MDDFIINYDIKYRMEPEAEDRTLSSAYPARRGKRELCFIPMILL